MSCFSLSGGAQVCKAFTGNSQRQNSARVWSVRVGCEKVKEQAVAGQALCRIDILAGAWIVPFSALLFWLLLIYSVKTNEWKLWTWSQLASVTLALNWLGFHAKNTWTLTPSQLHGVHHPNMSVYLVWTYECISSSKFMSACFSSYSKSIFGFY